MPVVVDEIVVMAHNKRLFGFNTNTGHREWFTEPVLSGPSLQLQARNGLVYVTVDDGDTVAVTAFDVTSGQEMWTINHSALPVRHELLPAITADMVYLPTGLSGIQTYNLQSGEKLDTLGDGGSIHDVTIATQNVNGDGTLYALSKADEDGDFVMAVNPTTRETLWKKQVSFNHSPYASLPTLTLDPASVYTPTKSGILALNRETGQRRWLAETDYPHDGPIVAAGNAIYVATNNNELHVYDYRTGVEATS